MCHAKKTKIRKENSQLDLKLEVFKKKKGRKICYEKGICSWSSHHLELKKQKGTVSAKPLRLCWFTRISTFWLSLSKGEKGSKWPRRVSFRVFHSYSLERGGPCGISVVEFRIYMERGTAQPKERLQVSLAPFDCDSSKFWQSLSKPIPAKGNPRPNWKEKLPTGGEDPHIHALGWGILLAYIFFPRVATIRLQPASYSDGGSLRTKLNKAMWGPPTPVPPVSPPHSPPLTWVILSTETGIPSGAVRGGSLS